MIGDQALGSILFLVLGSLGLLVLLLTREQPREPFAPDPLEGYHRIKRVSLWVAVVVSFLLALRLLPS